MIAKWILEVRRSREGRRLIERERLVNDITDLLTLLMDQQQMGPDGLAERVGKPAKAISRILQGKGLEALRTVSDLFFAMDKSLHVYVDNVGERRPMSLTEKVVFKRGKKTGANQ